MTNLMAARLGEVVRIAERLRSWPAAWPVGDDGPDGELGSVLRLALIQDWDVVSAVHEKRSLEV
jgi:hypothetical protein